MVSSKDQPIDLIYSSNFLKEIDWLKKHDRKLLRRVKDLCLAIRSRPFSGIGKPEPLKYELLGAWSRRIDKKNRLIYEIVDEEHVKIISCKDHYDDH